MKHVFAHPNTGSKWWSMLDANRIKESIRKTPVFHRYDLRPAIVLVSVRQILAIYNPE